MTVGGRSPGTDETADQQRDRISAQLAESEAHYRTLFDKIDEGFCIIEFIDGPNGPLSNYVHIEANPACERQLGIRDMVGTTIRDIGPDEADGWLNIYGRVLRTGEPIRFEREFVTNRGTSKSPRTGSNRPVAARSPFCSGTSRRGSRRRNGCGPVRRSRA